MPPMPRQDGIGSRAPTLVVALCWMRCAGGSGHVIWTSLIHAFYKHIVFEYVPGFHDQGMMLVLRNQLLCFVLSTSDQDCVSFQSILCHPSTQTRTILLHGVRKSIPNWKPSPNRTSIGFSQIAFPTTVLPKDDRIDSAQEERLGLPYWTMILAICVVVNKSKCLDIPIGEFKIICEHPFLLGYKLILRQLLVLLTLAV